jgi:hypothetical protein
MPNLSVTRNVFIHSVPKIRVHADCPVGNICVTMSRGRRELSDADSRVTAFQTQGLMTASAYGSVVRFVMCSLFRELYRSSCRRQFRTVNLGKQSASEGSDCRCISQNCGRWLWYGSGFSAWPRSNYNFSQGQTMTGSVNQGQLTTMCDSSTDLFIKR